MCVILAAKWNYTFKTILIRNWTLSAHSKSCENANMHFLGIPWICNWKGNFQELFKWLNCDQQQCNCPEFWLRTQCWANSKSRPLLLSVLPFFIVWPSLHFTISSHLASSQTNCKLFSLPKHTWVTPSLLCPSVLLRSVHWQAPDDPSYAELCKTTPHLSQLNLLAAHRTQSATVRMLMQVSVKKAA